MTVAGFTVTVTCAHAALVHVPSVARAKYVVVEVGAAIVTLVAVELIGVTAVPPQDPVNHWMLVPPLRLALSVIEPGTAFEQYELGEDDGEVGVPGAVLTVTVAV